MLAATELAFSVIAFRSAEISKWIFIIPSLTVEAGCFLRDGLKQIHTFIVCTCINTQIIIISERGVVLIKGVAAAFPV